MLKELEVGKKRITLEEIKKHYRIEEYCELAECVKQLIVKERIKPVKARGTNGKKPVLFNEYHLIEEKKDYQEYVEELKFQLCSFLDNSYYLKNLEKYKQDRDKVLQFNQYLMKHRQSLDHKISLNERSFEIWGREKYLKEEGGRALLKNMSFDMEDLGVYETIEPLAYYSHHKKSPQNILIIENKDTFYSLRKYMLEGHSKIMQVNVGTLIYGAGKGILKSMKDFDICMEPYMIDVRNTMLYFGDLDYEGILIYEYLFKSMSDRYQISPFTKAYETMLEKAAKVAVLPNTKEGQNRNISDVFLKNFKPEINDKLVGLLESGTYIPQEILNSIDFK